MNNQFPKLCSHCFYLCFLQELLYEAFWSLPLFRQFYIATPVYFQLFHIYSSYFPSQTKDFSEAGTVFSFSFLQGDLAQLFRECMWF